MRTFRLETLNSGDLFQRRIFVLTTGRRFTSTLLVSQVDTSATTMCVTGAVTCTKEYRGADNIELTV